MGLGPRAARGRGALAGAPGDRDRTLPGRHRHRGLTDNAAPGAAAEADLREPGDVAEADVTSHVDLPVRFHRVRRHAVDLGRRDTRVVESHRHGLARERELGVGQTLAEGGLPDPDDRGLVLDQIGHAAHQPFHSGAPALAERRDPLARVDGRGVHLDHHRLLFQQVAPRELRRVVQELLRPTDRLGGPGRQSLRPLLGRGSAGRPRVRPCSRCRASPRRRPTGRHRRRRAPSPCACRRRGGAGTPRRRRGRARAARTPGSTWRCRPRSTRSAASTSIEPPPAAVPFNATMTGFSQSWIACISCWNPARIMLTAEPTTRSGASAGRVPRCGLWYREVGACAEVTLACGGQHDRTYLEVPVRVAERVDQRVADVVRDRVALVGAVDRQPQDTVLEPRLQLVRHERGIVDSFTHCFTTNASRATAPRGRTTRGLISSSRTSPARSIARRCTFMTVSTSASTSTGPWPRTPSRSL